MFQVPAPRETSHKETMGTAITAMLREEIIRGSLAPGAPVRLQGMAERYGVSLSPLREALSRLSSEGLVQLEDQRGCRVAPVSVANCREVIRLRAELECLAFGESMRRGGTEWEAGLVAAYHRLKRVDAPQEIDAGYEQVHRAYHEALVAACGMPLLVQMCASLNNLYDRYRRLFMAKRPQKVLASDHDRIQRAALAQDVDAAVELLRRHITRAGDMVLPYVAAAEQAAAQTHQEQPRHAVAGQR